MSILRLFEGNTRPHEPFWVWKDATEEVEPGVGSAGTPAEVEIYGYISEYSWFEDDVTPKMFKDDLWKYGNGGPITIRMNSGGGDLIAANVIKSILMDYPGYKTVQIDGLAASAATVVAMGGDEIKMHEGAYFMIHDPSVSFYMATMSLDDLDRMLDALKTAKEGILDAYETRTGHSKDKLSRWMAKETWFTAREAVEKGFADVVIKKTKVNPLKNGSAAIVNALQGYVNVPGELMVDGGSDLVAELEVAMDVAEGDETKVEAPEAKKLRAESILLKKE